MPRLHIDRKLSNRAVPLSTLEFGDLFRRPNTVGITFMKVWTTGCPEPFVFMTVDMADGNTAAMQDQEVIELEGTLTVKDA